MRIFITGATGYLGTALIPRLVSRQHRVCALCRPGSEWKLPPGCSKLTGDALDASTVLPLLPRTDTLVHLVGVRRPAPWKSPQFHSVDLLALQQSVKIAVRRGINHFVFVSVARPAPIMVEYQSVRAVCEMVIGDAGLNATILRPWYVVGPGHRWPATLKPLYKAAELLPATRPAALRLGLVTREQMVRSLLWAVETPANGIRYLDVPAIRSLADLPAIIPSETTSVTGV
jgi:uncharacterized protein YbjT (DUF2867 family)